MMMAPLAQLVIALHVWSLLFSHVVIVVTARTDEPLPYTFSAIINITYIDPKTNTEVDEESEYGLFAADHADKAEGVLVHVRSSSNSAGGKSHSGCTTFENDIPREHWIALIERGDCVFSRKIRNAVLKNASAVLVYDNSSKAELVTMEHDGNSYMGGRVGSAVARRAIDLKVRGSSPAHGGSWIAG